MTDTTCQTCGTAIDTARSEGVCAICLFGDALDQEVNEMFGGHELHGVIARGGMGVVYRAMQREPRREVALKTLRGAELDSPEAQTRFRDEARTMAGLEHPGILPIHQFGQQDGVLFFTMKLAAGGSLAERTADYAGQWKKIAALIASVADAVQFAHEHGVLHRDIKPGNILFDEEGHAFVSDFGLAKLAERAEGGMTGSAAMLGTPHYMAPEIAAHGLRVATTATDVWSLGVVLYELLTQMRPFKSDSVPALMREIAEREPDALAQSVPSDLRVITGKALAKDPTRRYGSARALADDLRCWLEGRPITARPTPGAERLWLWAKRNPGMAAMSALLILGSIAAGSTLFSANQRLDEALQKSLFAEAEAVLGNDSLYARQRALSIVQQLREMGEVSTKLRSLAVRALSTYGMRRMGDYQSGFLNLGSSLDYQPDLHRYATGRGKTPGFQIASTDAKTLPVLVDASAPAYNTLFSPDGQWLSIRMRNGRVIVCNIDRPEDIVFDIPNTGFNWDNPVAFHPSGKCWLYSTGDQLVRRHLADSRTTLADEVVCSCPAQVHGLTYSPDGSRVAIKWHNGSGVWDIPSAKMLWQNEEPVNPDHLFWSPSGKSVGLSVFGQTSFRFLNGETGEVDAQFNGHMGTASRCAFHPVCPLMATIGWDHQLLLWDTSTGFQVARHPASTRSLKFSSDGTRIAFSPDTQGTSMFDLLLPEVWHQWDALPCSWAEAISADISADGRWLATRSTGGLLRLWDATERRALGEFKRSAALNVESGGAFWRDAQTLIEHGSSHEGGQPSVLHLSASMADHPPKLKLAEIDPFPLGRPTTRTCDRRSLIVTSATGSTVLVNDDGSTRLVIPKWGKARVVDVSPDDRWAVCRTECFEVRQVSGGKVVHSFKASDLTDVRFSPDGRFLSISSGNGTYIWSTSTWSKVTQFRMDLPIEKQSRVEFSPDGTLVAVRVAPGEIELHETKHWTLLTSLSTPGPPHQTSGTFAILWTPDSTRLIVLGMAQRVIDWDIPKLRSELGKLGLDWPR